jgi:hypothetical protein
VFDNSDGKPDLIAIKSPEGLVELQKCPEDLLLSLKSKGHMIFREYKRW